MVEQARVKAAIKEVRMASARRYLDDKGFSDIKTRTLIRENAEKQYNYE